MIFENAKPVWIKGKERILNESLAFACKLGGCERLVITASCRYAAYIDGKFIGFGPARAAHGVFRADRINLGNVREGSVLYIIACGYNTINYQSLNQPAFLQAEVFDGEISERWTGRDFVAREYTEKVRKVSRLSFQRAFSECYAFDGNPTEEYRKPDFSGFSLPDEVVGGRIAERGVSYPRYEERFSVMTENGAFYDGGGKIERNMATKLAALRIYPADELTSNPADTVCRLKYEKIGSGKEGAVKKGEYVLYDFGHAETGFIGTDFEAEEDSLVWFIYDEIDMNPDPDGAADVRFDRNGCVNIIEYKVKKGGYLHRSYEPYTARYVKMIVAEGSVIPRSLKIVSFENPDTDRFSLRCADEMLEKIVRAAVRTFAHNAVDILTDCPSRERAWWLCDSFFSARSEQLFTGYNKVERNFLENFADAPDVKNIPHGMVPMFYPADFIEEAYIPNGAMWYIVELYDAYLRTGDEYIKAGSKKKAEEVIGFFDKYVNEDGNKVDSVTDGAMIMIIEVPYVQGPYSGIENAQDGYGWSDVHIVLSGVGSSMKMKEVKFLKKI